MDSPASSIEAAKVGKMKFLKKAIVRLENYKVLRPILPNWFNNANWRPSFGRFQGYAPCQLVFLFLIFGN